MWRAIAMLILLGNAWAPGADPKPAPPKGEYAPGASETDLSGPAKAPVEKAKAFTAVADEVTATTFVSIAKDGTRQVHTIKPDAVILQAGKVAKFSDIKAGDTVTGLRTTQTAAEYTVTRITRFVSKPVKPAKPAPK